MKDLSHCFITKTKSMLEDMICFECLGKKIITHFHSDMKTHIKKQNAHLLLKG